MRKVKKALAFITVLCLLFTSAYAMPSNTVVVGNNAYDLTYAAGNAGAQMDIVTGIANAKVKVSGTWVNSNGAPLTSAEIAALPAVNYTDATGTTAYEAGDGDAVTPVDELEVVSVSAINATTISVTFDDGRVVEFSGFSLVPGENEVTFTYLGTEYTETVEYEVDYAFVITNAEQLAADSAAGLLEADGKTVMKVEAAILGASGEVDTGFIGMAEFVSKQGLKAAQIENAFDAGKVTFNVTLKNSTTDINDEIKVRILENGDEAVVGLESAPLALTYKAYTPDGDPGLITTYRVDSVKSTDMADRVDVYVGGLANEHADAVAEAIMAQVEIYNSVGNGPFAIVGIEKITQVNADSSISGDYAFRALLDLPEWDAAGMYTLAGLQAQVLEDDAYNTWLVADSTEDVRLVEDTDGGQFMLVDKFAPKIQDVIPSRIDENGNLDEDFLPANTMMVKFSEPVNRLDAENPSNWVLNGHRLNDDGANDVLAIAVLDIPVGEFAFDEMPPLDDDFEAPLLQNVVTKPVEEYEAVKAAAGRERSTVLIILTNTAAQTYLAEGENLLQGRSIADWAGVYDLSDNNKITTQDFIFDYEVPTITTEFSIEKESPEQYVLTVKGLYVDNDATTPVNLETLNADSDNPVEIDVRLVDKDDHTVVIRVLDPAEYRIVSLVGEPYKWILELTDDWTQLLNDPDLVENAYHNNDFMVTIGSDAADGELYDLYGVNVAPKSDFVNVPEDTTSPAVAVDDEGNKMALHLNNDGTFDIVMDEPVQLYTNVEVDEAPVTVSFVSPDITPSIEQLTGTGVPVPTFEYVKVGDGVVYSAGEKVTGIFVEEDTPWDEHDVAFTVEPSAVLEVGDWKLVVRQISDDVGNTMATEEFPFKITGETTEVSVDPYIVWAYADDEVVEDDGTFDYVYILYSRDMGIDVLRAATYDINGKQVTQDADITSQLLVLYNDVDGDCFGDALEADHVTAKPLAEDIPQWRGELVTIKLPSDFIVGGDDLGGGTKKNVLTVPTTLMAVDDGVEETLETLLFDNNDDSNQYELTFDFGFGHTGFDGENVGFPAINDHEEIPYCCVEHFINYLLP